LTASAEHRAVAIGSATPEVKKYFSSNVPRAHGGTCSRSPGSRSIRASPIALGHRAQGQRLQVRHAEPEEAFLLLHDLGRDLEESSAAGRAPSSASWHRPAAPPSHAFASLATQAWRIST
jgi:hypothetical protein